MQKKKERKKKAMKRDIETGMRSRTWVTYYVTSDQRVVRWGGGAKSGLYTLQTLSLEFTDRWIESLSVRIITKVYHSYQMTILSLLRHGDGKHLSMTAKY